jgi:hypothetical protein
MVVDETIKQVYRETAQPLKGSERRLFMARVVKALGAGGQRQAECELGWNRRTVRKGMHELESGVVCLDGYSARGGTAAEEHQPNLLTDIKAIVDGQSQTEPRFESNRLYTRLSAAEGRHQLIVQKGYHDTELPSQETIRVKLNALGYRLRTIRKSVPQKNSGN